MNFCCVASVKGDVVDKGQLDLLGCATFTTNIFSEVRYGYSMYDLWNPNSRRCKILPRLRDSYRNRSLAFNTTAGSNPASD